MIDFVFERAGGVGLLNFSGSLTTEGIARLQQGLMISLENADYVVVNFENVTGVDIRCLRMFCSAHQISLRSNKRLVLTGLSREVLGGTGESALLRHPDCASECQESCVWTMRQER